jgi:LysM repeat protein
MPASGMALCEPASDDNAASLPVIQVGRRQAASSAAAKMLASEMLGTPLLAAPRRVSRAVRHTAAPHANYTPSLRPYTVRKGDTLDSIAKKRELSVKEVVQYNAKSLKETSAFAAWLSTCP